jgi:hypothetical protein
VGWFGLGCYVVACTSVLVVSGYGVASFGYAVCMQEGEGWLSKLFSEGIF